MRVRTFFITYFAYVTIHLMRMAIPFTQYDIINFYTIDQSMMGWINGAIYLMCGCSYWWGVFRPLENLPKSYFFLVGLSGVVFMLIPISMFLGVHELFLFWLCLLAYAWFHARAYGIIAPMISRKFNPDNDGLALGIWTSSSDMGNVLAFFFFTLVIYGLSWSWKFCLLLSGFFALVMATLMLTLDDGTKEDTTAHATCSHYTKEIWQFVKIPDNVLATCVVLFSGASTYGVLLWLPMFLEGAGFKDFEGYISMTYSISTIIGTTILGKLYEITHKSRYHLMINCGTILLSIISFILIKSIPLEPSQKFVVLLLVGVVGFSMGSTFNLSFSHQIFLLADKNSPHFSLTFIMNILNWWLNFFIAITQVAFGAVSQAGHQYVFLMLIAMSCVLFALLLLRVRVNWQHAKVQTVQYLQEGEQQNPISYDRLN